MEPIKEEQLINACINNNIEVVRQLLSKEVDIDINYQENYGYTALIWACSLNNTKLVKELLKCQDININIQNGNRYTALTTACSWNYTEIVKELLKHPQIDFDIKTISGDNAYDIAKEKNNKEIMLLLKMKKLQQKNLSK